MIRKKLNSVSEGCSSLKTDINRLRRASQYHDVNGLSICEEKMETETLSDTYLYFIFIHKDILTNCEFSLIFDPLKASSAVSPEG